MMGGVCERHYCLQIFLFPWLLLNSEHSNMYHPFFK
jgi:hypothetical protein